MGLHSIQRLISQLIHHNQGIFHMSAAPLFDNRQVCPLFQLVKKFIDNRGNPEERKTIKRKSLLDPFHDNILYWLNDDPGYRATWTYDRLCNMGFTGSYEIVKRKAHEVKAEKQRVAYMLWMVGRDSLYTFEPFRPSGSFEPNVINPLNQFDKEAYLYIIAFKKDTLFAYFIVDVNTLRQIQHP